MATNAPYYQMRASQPSTNTNTTNVAAQVCISQDREHVLTPASAIDHPIENQQLPQHLERATHQIEADNQQNTFEENHNLVELLEAVTTAADQSSSTMAPSEITPAAPVPQSRSKRKRGFTPSTDASTTSQPTSQNRMSSSAKRQCIDPLPDSSNVQVTDRDTTTGSPTTRTSPSPSHETILTDARAAGVHSAAALFRRTSLLTTRKYTRPPMSKLFMSLNITPENFITLQALAKSYMLSPAHPERQSCVGSRGKGDTDMVKLRLFNCVRDFLVDGGVGEQFFGEHVEKPGERESSELAAVLGEEGGRGEKLVWPKDGNKIISLVTPLMRRMVTNERQRLYAIDTRKGGRKAEKDETVEAGSHSNSPGASAHEAAQRLHTAFDPTLERPAALQQSSPPTPIPGMNSTFLPNTTTPPASDPRIVSSPASTPATLPTDSAEPHLTHINIFLTYTSSNTKQSIKLDEKRISTTRPAHLTFYNYSAFVEQVSTMANQAEMRHPSLKIPRSTCAATEVGDSENLRGLAAAANALQPDKDDQLRPPTPTHDVSPRYTVKTIGPMGWQVVDNAETWYHVLTERAFAAWADGVCNFIVELRGFAHVLPPARKESADVEMEGA
ncbi:uncharacterized protein EKO05_0004082 [Ascochyta rabiei]|uniref:Uncharacterized protein n=1 Tax=Didymella rabiei TaxID=5454 RepID=A0A162Y218_DIDRA|nr:uncharacterized protein EKO05_0004082 [Ascochyta rabiei]KZM19792.1 hypothetical protein ST47_g9234 [Ascochyta rabiei]UPX13580.1 hypothetical protein EKO05_0004082 [Ascochyta rabiei]